MESMRKMKAKVGDVEERLKLNGESWTVVACLFADDAVLLVERKEELQRVLDEFNGVCVRRKLKVNVGKSKVMVVKEVMCKLSTLYRVGVPTKPREKMQNCF